MSDLELREEGERVRIEWSGEEIGFFVLDEAGAAAVGLLPTAPRVACRAVLEALRARGVDAVQARAPLFRYEARAMGFGGGLREQLRWGEAASGAFLDRLAVLLPGVPARVLPQSALRGAWSMAVHGLRNMMRVAFDPGDGRAALQVTLPRRDDLDAEAVACAVETALGVQARFLQASHHVRSIVFGVSSHGMASGRHAGETHHIGGTIDINPGYAFASGHDTFMEAAKARRSPGRRSRGQRPVSPAQVPAPWLPIDGVVAHELWHKIELARKAEDRVGATAFRRAVGELCGAASIEHALKDVDISRRIAREVSAYAATSPMEATAEMFMLWWCGPPPPDSLPDRFGEIVGRFFP